jgi:RTX calcium-binding nonapeptide repeat (4 copies)
MTICRRRLWVKPRLETLEDRLPPSASAALVDGTLYVSGDNGRNSIQISANAGDLVVIDNGTLVNRFASNQVAQIAVAAGDGDTTVKIAANVRQPATIEGGAGDDVLMAGGGPTTLIAGTGPAKLVGGPAPDILIAGGPNDILIGRSGKDKIQLGFGNDRVYGPVGEDIEGAQASDRIYQQLPADPPSDPGIPPDSPVNQLTPTDVNTLLERAAAATPSDDAIVAVVDREGNILGVRVEQNVSSAITGNTGNLVFAIDGAVAEARTGAFFASSYPNGAPLTSRTVQFISQSTITQREVQSNPSIADPNSTLAGPGFVAPIEIGAHFPPNIDFTPMVDLFDIESTNRDTTDPRFNATYLPGQSIPAPVSYGVQSGVMPTAEPRGLGTLPGGIPIYKDNDVVGGIGVFFPGTTCYATEENSSLNQALFDPSKPDRSLEAELIAFTAVGGASMVASCDRPAGAFDFRGAIGSAPALPADFGLPSNGIITLMGVRLDVVGPGGPNGPDVLMDLANRIGFGHGNPFSGVNERVTGTGAPDISAADLAADLAMVPPPAGSWHRMPAPDSLPPMLRRSSIRAFKKPTRFELPFGCPWTARPGWFLPSRI